MLVVIPSVFTVKSMEPNLGGICGVPKQCGKIHVGHYSGVRTHSSHQLLQEVWDPAKFKTTHRTSPSPSLFRGVSRDPHIVRDKASHGALIPHPLFPMFPHVGRGQRRVRRGQGGTSSQRQGSKFPRSQGSYRHCHQNEGTTAAGREL